MNIQQLRYVVATAEHGSMTAAAASLYVAQPALSRAVRLLERELEVTLFERDGRGVRLTPEGQAFATRAARVLDGIDALRLIGTEADPDDAGLVIAASPTLQSSMAIPTLATLREQGVAVHTRLIGCSSSAEVVELVYAGRADLGICDQVPLNDLEQLPLGRAEVKVYSAVGTPMPDRVTLPDLADVPLVVPTPGTERRSMIDSWFAAYGLTPTIAVESDERNAWLSAVLEGVASCIWHSVEHLPVSRDRIVGRGFDPPIHQEFTALHRPGEMSSALRLLIDVLHELAELEPA
jgi:LysR family cyn operon transcriptional activator